MGLRRSFLPGAADPPCLPLTLYEPPLFTQYFTFYFCGKENMENTGFDINRPEFKNLHFLAI